MSRSSFYIGNLAWTQSSTFKNLPLNPWEAELLKLQEAVQHCKTQLTIERRRREDLEVELDITEQENKSLQTKVCLAVNDDVIQTDFEFFWFHS